jgi:hypothetical protein
VAFPERKEAGVEVVEGFHLVQGPQEEEEEGRKEMGIVG